MLDIYSGKKRDVVMGKKHKVNEWFCDADGNVRLGRRDRKHAIEFVTRSKSDPEKWEAFEAFVGDSLVDFNITGKSYVARRVFIA
jgi:hypothetical protein